MARKKKMTSVVISFRKNERHNRGEPICSQEISPLDYSHSLLTKADPDLTNTLEYKRRMLRGDYDIISNQNQQERQRRS